MRSAGRRLAALEARGRRPLPTGLEAALRQMAAVAAKEAGLDEGEVHFEAESFLRRARSTGAVTPRALAELVAAEEGRDAAEVLAEAERLAAEWGGTA